MAPQSVDEELEEEEIENPEQYDKFCKSLAEFAEQRGYERAPLHSWSYKLTVSLKDQCRLQRSGCRQENRFVQALPDRHIPRRL